MAAKVLFGWKRDETRHGIVLTVQLATSRSDFTERAFEKVSIVMNDRQLRSLARDLARAAHERGLDVFARRWWWPIGLSRL